MVKLGTSTLMFSVRFRVLVFLEKFREYFFFTGNCVYGRAMLSIGLISLLIAVPLFSYQITPSLFNRITAITLLFSSFLSFNAINVESLASGVGIYSGLFHVTNVSLSIEAFLLFIGAILLLG